MATQIVGGWWHGASWNFIIWGGLNGFGQVFNKIWVKRSITFRAIASFVLFAASGIIFKQTHIAIFAITTVWFGVLFAGIYAVMTFRLFSQKTYHWIYVAWNVSLTTASQSFVFKSPRPIDTIRIQFRWLDSLKQAEVAKFITDSLVQDSIERAKADSLKDSAEALKQGTPKDSAPKAKIPNNVALPNAIPARDSMFQGECDVLDFSAVSIDGKS